MQNKNVHPDKVSRPVQSQSRKLQQKAATQALNSNNSFNKNAIAAQSIGDIFSPKGTNHEKTTSNANVLQLYSQLSSLLLKKDGATEQNKRTPKGHKKNKSLSKSNINLNTTQQFSDKK